MNKYMEIAKNKSIKGFKNKEGGPFGAVITDKDGNIIAEAMRKAFEKPCEDTIFQLAAVTEAKSYKQGFQDCLELIKELFH